MIILRSELQKQVVRKGMTGRGYNTIAENVIGKYVVLIKINDCITRGVGFTEEEAIEEAKKEYNEIFN